MYKINQLLYGYDNGHRLLSGSIELDESLNWELVRTTDRPNVNEQQLDQGVTFGFELNATYYVLCRTWSAKSIDRPGAVWTHVLLLEQKLLQSPIQFLPFLHAAKEPTLDFFYKPILFDGNDSQIPHHSTSPEVVNLLLLIASKPKSGFSVISKTDPLSIFLDAQKIWNRLLYKQSFSNFHGKKNIENKSSSIIISPDSFNFGSPIIDKLHLSDTNFSMFSDRIQFALEILDHDYNLLINWLIETRRGINQTNNNLKLVMETLLLGKGKLEDDKLLSRITSAVDPHYSVQEIPLLKYAMGVSISLITPPPNWVLPLFLLGESSWGGWSQLITSSEVGRSAASAPVDQLAQRLDNLGSNQSITDALESLCSKISRSHFEELFNISESAASKLIQINPDLLFYLSKADQKNRKLAALATGNAHRNLFWDLEYLDRSPSLWRPIIAKAIRFARSDEELISYTIDSINNGSWENLSDAKKDFLLDTPNVIDELLSDNLSTKTLNVLLTSSSKHDIVKSFDKAIKAKSTNVDDLANLCVKIYGAENHIDILDGMSNPSTYKFISSLSDARWRNRPNRLVLSQIRIDIDKVPNKEKVLDLIHDPELLKALTPPSKKDHKTDEL